MSKNSTFLDNPSNEPAKFRTKNWVEINDNARGTYNRDSQIKFKTSMLRLSFCDYSDAIYTFYILVKGTIIIAPVPPPATKQNNNDKEEVFKNIVPFTDYVSEIKNTQIDRAKDIDVVMLMYNSIEYSNNIRKFMEIK